MADTGMPWPARCLDCGLETGDPDAYVVGDCEMAPERCCPKTGDEHRWADEAEHDHSQRHDDWYFEDGCPVPKTGAPRWHHSPDAPPEHFCEDCDGQLSRVTALREAVIAAHEWLVLEVNSTDERYLQLLDQLEPLARATLAEDPDAPR